MTAPADVHPLLRPFLDRAGVLVLDGALATELERRGADLRDPLWSARVLLENPGLIRQVHRDYFDAGADVATTASYQASFPGLLRRGLDDRAAAAVLRRSVDLARTARDEFRAAGLPAGRREPLVAASVGCYGAFRHDGSEYRGNYRMSVRALMDWHRPRLDVLAASGADLLACETIPCLAEAEALTRLLDEGPGIPAWISFSCRDGRHLCHSETLAEAVDVVAGCPRVLAVGVNCTAPAHVEALLRSVAGRTAKPLLAYPNSGEGWDAARQAWTGGDAECDWGAMAGAWYAAGARLVGGCCRTTPATIRTLRAALVRSEL